MHTAWNTKDTHRILIVSFLILAKMNQNYALQLILWLTVTIKFGSREIKFMFAALTRKKGTMLSFAIACRSRGAPVSDWRPAPHVEKKEPITMTQGLGQARVPTTRFPLTESPNLQETKYSELLKQCSKKFKIKYTAYTLTCLWGPLHQCRLQTKERCSYLGGQHSGKTVRGPINSNASWVLFRLDSISEWAINLA